MSEPCWVCDDLGALAIHYQLSEQLGRKVLVPHRPESSSHPVIPCPGEHRSAGGPVVYGEVIA